MSYCNFKPKTKGEHLFQYIVKDLIQPKRYRAVNNLELLQIGDRTEDFSEYFVGVFAVNILARAMKKAKTIVRDIEDEKLHQRHLVKYFQLSLGLTGSSLSGGLDRFAILVLESEKSSNKSISNSVKSEMFKSKALYCYICGVSISRSNQDSNLNAELEHIWPQSYGGDSIIENLLPACFKCNKDKGNMILWQNANVHSFVLKPNPSEDEFENIRRVERIAKHRRTIFKYACEKNISLKEAAYEVGPINIMNKKKCHFFR